MVDVAASYKDNRIANCFNGYQTDRKRVLCVCSAGMLRSPTAAWVLSNEPYGYNTRACGSVPEYALVPLDEVLITWADEIICMGDKNIKAVAAAVTGPDFIIAQGKFELERFQFKTRHIDRYTKVFNLHIPDNYEYRDQGLVNRIMYEYDRLVLGKDLPIGYKDASKGLAGGPIKPAGMK